MSALAYQPKRPLRVVGNSMSPTYADGEWLLTSPVNRPLQRGDVVVIDTDSGPILKRIALIPGDRHFQFHTLSGWVDLVTFGAGTQRKKQRFRYATVPPGTIFVLGDHLSSSIDSRSFGLVPMTSVRRIVEQGRHPSDQSEIARKATKLWRAT